MLMLIFLCSYEVLNHRIFELGEKSSQVLYIVVTIIVCIFFIPQSRNKIIVS